MTEEQLKKHIEQSDWVWIANRDNLVRSIQLNNDAYFGLQLNNTFFILDNFLRSEFATKIAKLDNIYETKEQVLWALKTVTERTERFEPPMWEEIKDKYSFGFMNCKNSVVRFSVFKNYNSLNHIVVYCADYDDYIYRDMSTKENYEKACEIVRDLFNKEVKQ